MPTYNNYPKAARSAARRALKFKETQGTSCGTPVGWQRANQIASGESLSLATVKRTFSFLSRAKVYNQGKFTDADGKPICGSIMYAAWGGSSMLPWCKRVIAEAERNNVEDKEERSPRQKDKHMEQEQRTTEVERRSYVASDEHTEVRLADEGRTVEGYAAVFNQPTMIGAVEEVVSPGAFDDRLMDDVVALFNHDMNMPLARSYNGQGTLELKVDEHGLYYKFNLGDQSYAKDLAESIKRGDVRGSSFGFVVREDDYEKKDDGTYRRTIKSLARIADVSPVVSPAYPQTSVKMRDAIAALEAEPEVVEETPVQDEIQPTSAPKRKVAEALLSIHHHKTLSK
jgi:hypothetical protein